MEHEAPGQTLEATGSQKASGWDSRGHFFAAAAEAMRGGLAAICTFK
jgi:hypothetical protein